MLGVLTGNPNEDLVIKSELYNTIISEGLRNMVVNQAGDIVNLCINEFEKHRSSKLGSIEIPYAENDCRIRLRS